MKKSIINISLLLILFFGNVYIKNYNIYFVLIYIGLFAYHVYIFLLFFGNNLFHFFEIKNYIFISILLFVITYFIICDSNPFFCIIAFYSFYPNFIKAVLIIFTHTYILYRYINNINKNLFNRELSKETFDKFQMKPNLYVKSYFFSEIIIYCGKNKHFITISLILIFLIIINIILFLNRTYIWVHFNKVDKTLPIFHSKKTKFYIASNIFNVESIIHIFIKQMKKLIQYLGENNVIISIVENGDSKDNTRTSLKEFENYLNDKKIINRFVLTHEINDPRKEYFTSLKYTRLRIEYYSQLRNKCFELLYELPNIDYNNTMILFFNDIVFNFEDIINLLSTNNEDYDVACGLDMSFMFYDRWVSIDFDGEGMTKYFPYFINKEGQDLIINHKPIRVFSCWNGVTAFKALPLKDKKIQFRYKLNSTLPKFILKNPAKTYYESECTYFNIDININFYLKQIIIYHHLNTLQITFGYILLVLLEKETN